MSNRFWSSKHWKTASESVLNVTTYPDRPPSMFWWVWQVKENVFLCVPFGNIPFELMARLARLRGCAKGVHRVFGGLTGLQDLLRAWSCWQMKCSLCDHTAVMEMAGAVCVAGMKKKSFQCSISVIVKTQLFWALLTCCGAWFQILSSSLLPCWRSL